MSTITVNMRTDDPAAVKSWPAVREYLVGEINERINFQHDHGIPGARTLRESFHQKGIREGLELARSIVDVSLELEGVADVARR